MKKCFLVLLSVGLLEAAVIARAVPAQDPQDGYRIGPQDVVAITVYNEADLSRRYTIEADGSFTFPLLGRIQAAGLTPRELEAELKRRLDGRILKDPQVTVAVEEYRSQRVFVHGEVRSPGTYQLTGNMTVLEALARAGSTTSTAADSALIVRPAAGGQTAGRVLPGEDSSAQVIPVDLAALQAGSLKDNVPLRDGDTIVVPRAQSIYVYGQVRTPGAYPPEKGMTVMQALTLAGGLSDRGTTRGLKIIRTVNGKKKEVKVKLTDLVQPGDTIVVKERLF
jgi:polysaccharide export outer membrane protein